MLSNNRGIMACLSGESVYAHDKKCYFVLAKGSLRIDLLRMILSSVCRPCFASHRARRHLLANVRPALLRGESMTMSDSKVFLMVEVL